MKVKDLIKKLEKYNPEMNVLGEYDMDGDEFMVKVDIDKIYKGDGNDDSFYDEDDNEKFIIIKLKETRD